MNKDILRKIMQVLTKKEVENVIRAYMGSEQSYENTYWVFLQDEVDSFYSRKKKAE